jgi:hypothetical protein
VADAEVGCERDDLTDHLLAVVVGRVRLAREHELHRAVPCGQQRVQPLGLRQQQRRPLVGREAPREAHGERLRVEHLVGPRDIRARQAASERRLAQPAAHERDEPLTALLARPPHLVVASVVDAVPPVRAGFAPLGQHVAAQQVGHLRRDPRARVHAVGERHDRRLVGGDVRPEVREHVA